MLSSLRQQMSRLAVGLRGTVGASELDPLAEADAARRRRSLGGGHRDHPGTGQEVSRGPEDESDSLALPASNSRPRHGLRHRHRQRQHARHRERPPSTAATTAAPASPSIPTTDYPLSQNEGNAVGEGVVPGGQGAGADPTEESADVSSSPRDGHAACYGPDQVVLIIALTCALNFACIFLVMALVHICNRNRKCASSGCDSPLLLVDSDYEVDPKACLVSSAEEDDDYEDDIEVDALLLAKRPSASLFAPFLPQPFPPVKHPTPWRLSSHLSGAAMATEASSGSAGCTGSLVGNGTVGVGMGERRRSLASSSSSSAVAATVASSSSRPLLPPAAFSMEDLHILE